MNALAIRVVDVRAKHMDEDAALIVIIVRVARDVVAALKDGDAEPHGLGKAAGAHGAGVSCADNDHVVLMRVEASRKTKGDLHRNSLDRPAARRALELRVAQLCVLSERL